MCFFPIRAKTTMECSCYDNNSNNNNTLNCNKTATFSILFIFTFQIVPDWLSPFYVGKSVFFTNRLSVCSSFNQSLFLSLSLVIQTGVCLTLNMCSNRRTANKLWTSKSWIIIIAKLKMSSNTNIKNKSTDIND